MTHPWWKKSLSYLKEISLEQTSSPHNPYLEVLLVKGRHQLTTREAIYSYDDKYENFNYAFKQIDWSQLKGKKVLVLGLGLGSVIYILEKILKLTFDYTAVEIDEEICRMAQSYTLRHLDSYVEVVPTEAMSFLSYNESDYDIVIMDIFQSAEIPQKFQTEEFLKLLKSKLAPGGILFYNRMNITDADIADNKHFKTTMEKVFPMMAEIKIKTNLVSINDKAFLK